MQMVLFGGKRDGSGGGSDESPRPRRLAEPLLGSRYFGQRFLWKGRRDHRSLVQY